MKKILAFLTALILSGTPALALAAEPVCAVVTSTVPITDFTPRRPLERLYYDTAVCMRKRALDAESRVKSSSASLAARELIPDLVPGPPDSEPMPRAMQFAFFGLGGVAVGVVACIFFCPRSAIHAPNP